MGLEHETAFRADGDYAYGFKTKLKDGHPNVTVGADLTGRSIGVNAKGKHSGVTAVADKGIGVSGSSYGQNERGRSVGVLGYSDHPEGTGVEGSGNFGVVGLGKYAPGVTGDSMYFNGGLFSSDKRAQIHFVLKLEKLPVEGRQGDLIAILAKQPSLFSDVKVGMPQLWFCVKDGDSKAPAWWAQVLLGQPEPAKP